MTISILNATLPLSVVWTWIPVFYNVRTVGNEVTQL